jgi:hypothetical protein
VPRIDGSQDRLFEIGHQFRLSYLILRRDRHSWLS